MGAIVKALELLLGADAYTLSVIALSFKIAAASFAVAVLVGLPLGVALGMTRFAGRLGILILVNAAMGLPPVVAGLATFMLIRNDGALGDLQLLYTPAAMVISQVPLAAPLIAGISMAAIASVPRAKRWQARALGSSRWGEARMLARETRTSLMAACIAGFGATISEVGAILITGGNLVVGGENYTRTMTTAIVLETRLGNFERALAFALILMAAIVLTNFFLTRIQIARFER